MTWNGSSSATDDPDHAWVAPLDRRTPRSGTQAPARAAPSAPQVSKHEARSPPTRSGRWLCSVHGTGLGAIFVLAHRLSSFAIASPNAKGRANSAKAANPSRTHVEDRPANRPGRGRRRQTVHRWSAPAAGASQGRGVRRASSTTSRSGRVSERKNEVGEASACKPSAAPPEATVASQRSSVFASRESRPVMDGARVRSA
jgi:hypothetical protein